MKHHSKSKVGRRRSHLALKPTTIAVCSTCKYPALAHKICANCGSYKGKVVIAKKVKAKK